MFTDKFQKSLGKNSPAASNSGPGIAFGKGTYDALSRSSSGDTSIDPYSAYTEVDIIRSIVDFIVEACYNTPFEVLPTDEDKLKSPLSVRVNKMLNIRPNEHENKGYILSQAYLEYLIYGNAYFYYDEESNKDYIYLLHANNITVKKGKDGKKIEGYDYTVQNEQESIRRYTTSEKNVFYPAETVIHVQNTNLRNNYEGQSALSGVMKLVSLYKTMLDYQATVFKNHAIPRLVIQTDNQLSQDTKTEFLSKWDANYGALARGTGKTALLDNGLKVQDVGNLSFTDLDFENSIKRISTDIAARLGVPYVLLNPENNTNIPGSQKIFYEHKVIPTVNAFGDAFASFFDSKITVRAKRTAIDVLRPEIKAHTQSILSLVNGGLISPNEGRAEIEYPPVEGQDDLRNPENIVGGSSIRPNIGGRTPNEDTTDE